MNDITLSPDQDRALDSICRWWEEVRPGQVMSESKQILTVGGYAGTGKTTILAFLRDQIGEDYRVAYLSYTGKAVSVMEKKLNATDAVSAQDWISTIHSYMYVPIIDPKTCEILGWKWSEMCSREDYGKQGVFGTYPVDLFIIDEASMVPKSIYTDLLNYGKPILAVGDHGQLPPIKSDFSLMSSPMVRLEKIHRQAENNPILILAHMARRGEHIYFEEFSRGVMKISKARFDGSIAEKVVANSDPNTLVITNTNKMRTNINKRVRVFKEHTQQFPPQERSRVICLKNDRRQNLYNGMLATVMRNLDNGWTEIFEDEADGSTVVKMAESCFLRPEGINGLQFAGPRSDESYWDYGYALTCHKAQGSEAKKVVIMGEGFGEHKDRWMYTAITRAQEELYIVS